MANVAAEVEARTIGASVLTPDAGRLDPGRHWDVDPFLGIPPITVVPVHGLGARLLGRRPARIRWDDRQPRHGAAADGNLPPRTEDGYGDDPHSYPRRDVQARQMKSDFLKATGGGIRAPV